MTPLHRESAVYLFQRTRPPQNMTPDRPGVPQTLEKITPDRSYTAGTRIGVINTLSEMTDTRLEMTSTRVRAVKWWNTVSKKWSIAINTWNLALAGAVPTISCTVRAVSYRVLAVSCRVLAVFCRNFRISLRPAECYVGRRLFESLGLPFPRPPPPGFF